MLAAFLCQQRRAEAACSCRLADRRRPARREDFDEGDEQQDRQPVSQETLSDPPEGGRYINAAVALAGQGEVVVTLIVSFLKRMRGSINA